MTDERALEIIAAYGADAARWPVTERADALARIAASPVLQAALADVRATDATIAAMLIDWASVAPTAADSARLAAAARVSTPRWNRWIGGGLAAAIAASLIAIAPIPPLWGGATEQQGTTPPNIIASASTDSQFAEAVMVTDSEAYAMLFTLTPQEESLI